MGSKELAIKIMDACKDMDYMDYEDHYETELKKLTTELELVKEIGLNRLLEAFKILVD